VDRTYTGGTRVPCPYLTKTCGATLNKKEPMPSNMIRDDDGNVLREYISKDFVIPKITEEQDEAYNRRKAAEDNMRGRLAAHNMALLGGGEALAEVREMMETCRRTFSRGPDEE
jgi:hypothetical protein